MLVNTIHGELDDSTLILKTGTEEDSQKTLIWTEYYLADELVHRSVDMYLKQGIDFDSMASNIC